MDFPNSFVRTPLTALVLLGITQGAQAGVIDTTPPDSLSPYYAFYAAAGDHVRYRPAVAGVVTIGLNNPAHSL